MKNKFFIVVALLFSLIGCKEKDNDPSVVKSVECEEDEIVLDMFEGREVSVVVLPENAEDKHYEWEILDNSIASVSENMFTGLKPGETWAVVFNVLSPDKKDSLHIVVKDFNIAISCEKDTVEMFLYSQENIAVSVTSDEVSDLSFSWIVADTTIAAANENVIDSKIPGKTWAYVVSNANQYVKDSILIVVRDYPKKSIDFSDENIHYEGRIVFDEKGATYTYPGSSFSTEFTGTSVSGLFNTKKAYYWVEIDNQEPYKFTTGKKTQYVEESGTNPGTFWLAKNLKPGKHTVKVTLCSEAITLSSAPKFFGFVVDENSELSKPSPKPYKFEFLGNSITCGYGIEVTKPSYHFDDTSSNFCKSYSYLTAKEFNADVMVVARSGIGVYRNYGNEAGYGLLPENYEKTWLKSSTNWDFSKYIPDVVFINLGTNDTYDMSTFSSENFKKAYGDFLTTILSHYPNAKIVLLTGSMMTNSVLNVIKPILDELQSEYGSDSHPIYRFDFKPTNGIGADYHPCAAQQAQMAEDLIQFLKENVIQK